MGIDADRVRCRSCRRPMPRSGSVCQACGADQLLLDRPAARPLPPRLRSVGVAVLLSVAWLGVGHLYAGRTEIGAALVAYNAVLVLMSATLIGLIFSVPMWLLSAPLAALLAGRAVAEDNRLLLAVVERANT